MGLSSDNMQTLKRLESLAGRRLSIMALKYVRQSATRHLWQILMRSSDPDVPKILPVELQGFLQNTSVACFFLEGILKDPEVIS